MLIPLVIPFALLSLTGAGLINADRPYIATHDAKFHCDEVTACFMLKQLDRFKDHDIVRTRDPKILAGAEIVVDVGQVFDPATLRFDHHQDTFQMNMHNFHPDIPTTNPEHPPRLASSGLIYAHFGKDIITKILNLGGSYNELRGENKEKVDAVFKKAYVAFFEEVDAHDNGIDVGEGPDVVYNYQIKTGISARVSKLNRGFDSQKAMRNFQEAMELVGSEIVPMIKYYGRYWWSSRKQLRKMVEESKEIDPTGQIVYVKNTSAMTDWRSTLDELEEELGIVGQFKYIVFKEMGRDGQWRMVTVSKGKSYSPRVPLKAEWRGKVDEQLRELSGVPDATFVHNSGFTGGAKSFEGVLKMVRKSLGLEQ